MASGSAAAESVLSFWILVFPSVSARGICEVMKALAAPLVVAKANHKPDS